MQNYDEITALRAALKIKQMELARAEKVIGDARIAASVLYDAPELNPSNYDHDQVCLLNAMACEVCSILDKAFKAYDGTRAEQRGGER